MLSGRESPAYPDGTAFVAADLPELWRIVEQNVHERRTTAIVHDDGTEVLIEPPAGHGLALALALLADVLLRQHARPKFEAGGEVIELPFGSRVRLRTGQPLPA